MNFSMLNPYVKNVAIYERVNRTEPCFTYDCRILYLISGELTVSIYDGKTPKKTRLSPGNLIYIPSGQKYSLKSKYMRCAAVSFTLSPEGGEEAPLPSAEADFDPKNVISTAGFEPFDKVIFIEDMEAERDGFISMNNLFTSAEGYIREELSAKVKLLLLKLANLCDESALPSSMVENLDNYIRENIHDEISNTELGAIFGYHPFYISRMLKAKKGITLHQYVINFRMKSALRLLECSELSIADVADKTGFTDASYFTKTFKAQMGMTPKEYRNKFKEDFI